MTETRKSEIEAMAVTHYQAGGCPRPFPESLANPQERKHWHLAYQRARGKAIREYVHSLAPAARKRWYTLNARSTIWATICEAMPYLEFQALPRAERLRIWQTTAERLRKGRAAYQRKRAKAQPTDDRPTLQSPIAKAGDQRRPILRLKRERVTGEDSVRSKLRI